MVNEIRGLRVVGAAQAGGRQDLHKSAKRPIRGGEREDAS